MEFLFFLCLLSFGIVIAYIGYSHKKTQEIKDKIKALSNNTTEITPSDFFLLRNSSLGRRNKNASVDMDFTGVYILFNQTKNKYYVGQGKSVFNRVNSHFTGHGNGDVYADYKYGDVFTIRMIRLDQSGFQTLNELERNTIMTYNAFSKGYNKTRGNRG